MLIQYNFFNFTVKFSLILIIFEIQFCRRLQLITDTYKVSFFKNNYNVKMNATVRN